MGLETIILVVSVAIALVSTIFAWIAIRTSNKTYKAGIIAQVYEKYHSPSIRKDLQKVWEIYGKTWYGYRESAKEASNYADKGEPISMEMAMEVLNNLDKNSPEYIAIDNINGLWTYIMMLAFNGILGINELSSFVTPRILGFLYPLEEAKASKYGYSTHRKFSLKNLYNVWKKKYPKSF